jgi:hypothetical protein
MQGIIAIWYRMALRLVQSAYQTVDPSNVGSYLRHGLRTLDRYGVLDGFVYYIHRVLPAADAWLQAVLVALGIS